MTTATPLRRKQVKELAKMIEDQFGVDFPDNYNVYLNSKQRVFILKIDHNFESLNQEFIRTDRMGLYFGEFKDNFFRPSMQGAQFIARLAKEQGVTIKNVLKLNDAEARAFFAGVDLNVDKENCGSVIVMHNEDVLGFSSIKDGKLLNFTPKTFRGTTIV